MSLIQASFSKFSASLPTHDSIALLKEPSMYTHLWTPHPAHPSCVCVCHEQPPVGYPSDGLPLRAWTWIGHGGGSRDAGAGYLTSSRP